MVVCTCINGYKPTLLCECKTVAHTYDHRAVGQPPMSCSVIFNDLTFGINDFFATCMLILELFPHSGIVAAGTLFGMWPHEIGNYRRRR